MDPALPDASELSGDALADRFCDMLEQQLQSENGKQAAMETLAPIMSQDPFPGSTLMLMGITMAKRKKFVDAAECFQQAYSVLPRGNSWERCLILRERARLALAARDHKAASDFALQARKAAESLGGAPSQGVFGGTMKANESGAEFREDIGELLSLAEGLAEQRAQRRSADPPKLPSDPIWDEPMEQIALDEYSWSEDGFVITIYFDSRQLRGIDLRSESSVRVVTAEKHVLVYARGLQYGVADVEGFLYLAPLSHCIEPNRCKVRVSRGKLRVSFFKEVDNKWGTLLHPTEKAPPLSSLASASETGEGDETEAPQPSPAPISEESKPADSDAIFTRDVENTLELDHEMDDVVACGAGGGMDWILRRVRSGWEASVTPGSGVHLQVSDSALLVASSQGWATIPVPDEADVSTAAAKFSKRSGTLRVTLKSRE
mmetsp:Transcript_26026/g.67031  ORF Transcript_26026/g.67031 Transcript_26026/m.67031 type:complete len:433 (-) Transcript_26026:73-1371(-)